MIPLFQPSLDAGRFRLRPFTPGDADLIVEISTDPLIPLITTVPGSGTRGAALAYIARQHHRLVERSGYSYAIAEGASDEAIGQIGLWLKNVEDGRASVGYWVAAPFRGRGAATAALEAISAWGFTLPGIARLELYVEPSNEASWRVAERCGYRREGLLRSWERVGERRADMYMYSLLPGDRDDG